MKAHTIITKARMIAPGGILAMSLAVVLLAATASTAGTTPTPPAPPLTLGVSSSWGEAFPHQKLRFRATTSNDSTLVAKGRWISSTTSTSGKIKKTTKQLAAGEETKIAVRVKDKKLLGKQTPPKATVKVKLAATDEFGQTATDEFKLRILVHGGGGVIVIKDCATASGC